MNGTCHPTPAIAPLPGYVHRTGFPGCIANRPTSSTRNVQRLRLSLPTDQRYRLRARYFSGFSSRAWLHSTGVSDAPVAHLSVLPLLLSITLDDSMCLLKLDKAAPHPSDAPHARVLAMQDGVVSGWPVVGGRPNNFIREHQLAASKNYLVGFTQPWAGSTGALPSICTSEWWSSLLGGQKPVKVMTTHPVCFRASPTSLGPTAGTPPSPAPGSFRIGQVGAGYPSFPSTP